jgi:hypothetical protein
MIESKNTFSGKSNMSELRMRKFWLMAFAIVMSFAISASLARGADDKEKGASPLEDEMIAANNVLKKLKTQITDSSKNQSSLQMIQDMQKHFLAAKGMEPLRTKKESDKAKFVTEYRKAMVALMSEMLKMETAVIDNKNEEAAAILKNLTKVKADGHEKFQEE